MSAYGQLNAISDPAVRQIIQMLVDRNTALQTRVATLEATALLRTSGEVAVAGRLSGVSDPTGQTDAVNVQTMRKYVTGQLGAFAAPAP